MPRTYTPQFNAVAITAAQDIFQITPVAGKPVKILGLVIGQYSDVGDAASENLNVKISRGWATTGSGGTDLTTTSPPADPSDGAAGFGAKVNNTTVASAGTEVVLFSDVWNTQAGYQMWFPEGAQYGCNSTTGVILTVRITAPADSITTNATLFVQEG